MVEARRDLVINQRLLRVATQWHRPAPTVLVGSSWEGCGQGLLYWMLHVGAAHQAFPYGNQFSEIFLRRFF